MTPPHVSRVDVLTDLWLHTLARQLLVAAVDATVDMPFLMSPETSGVAENSLLQWVFFSLPRGCVVVLLLRHVVIEIFKYNRSLPADDSDRRILTSQRAGMHSCKQVDWTKHWQAHHAQSHLHVTRAAVSFKAWQC